MDYEILGAEDDEQAAPGPPRRPAAVLVAAVAALFALVAAVLLFGPPGDWAATTATQAGPTPSSQPDRQLDEYRGWVISDRALVTAPVPPPRAELSLGSLCDPVLGPGGTSLRVQFQLVNSGATQLRLRDVRPYFPLPGYLKLAHASAGGICTEPGTEQPARYLAAGERVLITWDLRLRQRCPKPAPVLAAVRARLITGDRTWQFPLFADLGAIPFAGC